MAREKFAQSRHAMSYIVADAARWTKSLKFTLSIAVDRGGLAKNNFFGLWRRKKRELDWKKENWMCPKPFSQAKNKRKLFSDGKSRRPLLARVALNKYYIRTYFADLMTTKYVNIS